MVLLLAVLKMHRNDRLCLEMRVVRLLLLSAYTRIFNVVCAINISMLLHRPYWLRVALEFPGLCPLNSPSVSEKQLVSFYIISLMNVVLFLNNRFNLLFPALGLLPFGSRDTLAPSP